MNELEQYTEDLHQLSTSMHRAEQIVKTLGLSLKSLDVDFDSAYCMVEYLCGYIDCMLDKNIPINVSNPLDP
ncbi:MAG: hypothetical protein FWE38_04280 [Firmicutes bacterium]|nr:hypothetical protein [Bacillota bacterium]